MPAKRKVRKSTDTYCSTHDKEFKGKHCPVCTALPSPRLDPTPLPDEANVLDPEYVIDGTGTDWITCRCGALRVLPLTDACPLCGRDVPR